MTNLKEQFYQTKNIEFLKKTLGRELWVQVSGSKDINGASAAFWAALMPVENIDEAYRDYSWNSYIGTQCPGFIEYGDKITYEANPLNFDSCLNIVQYREFYGIKPNYVEISEEFRLLNNLLNTTRVSNFFIEIRVVSYLESLAIQGFPFFCVWLMCIGKHQNCEDVFIRRHRYMNTAFRYSYFDMLLQTLAVSCISAFDGGEPHYKNGYTHPRSSENAVQKCIHAGRSPLF